MKIVIGDKQTIASFDVDAQKGFTIYCPNELPVINGHSIVEELNAQAKLAEYRLGSKDAHPYNALWVANEVHLPFTEMKAENMDRRWPVHCVPGTLGFEGLDGLPKITEYDYFVWKGIEPDLHPYSACYHDLGKKLTTGLIEFLKIKKVQTILVGGLATDYCVKINVLDLLEQGFQVVVNLGACRGLVVETTQQAIHEMKQYGALFVASASELVHHDTHIVEDELI